VLDDAFAKTQVEVFQSDLRSSHLVTLEEWKNRPRRERFNEWLAGLLRRQL
jgi:hypothetical protein